MRIAIIGAGAMGSVYAGLLAAAGNEVWVVDQWAEHVEAIRERGLRVQGASGDRLVRVHATTDAHEVGEAELVVIATKATDVEAAAVAARPLVGAGTLPSCPYRTGLGAPTGWRRSWARIPSRSASSAASARRSSAPATPTTTGRARPAGRAARTGDAAHRAHRRDLARGRLRGAAPSTTWTGSSGRS